MKENGFTLKKASRRYPTQTFTDADYANDIALFANTPTKAESLLHSLEQVAGGIGLHVNADKMEYMCLIKKAVVFVVCPTNQTSMVQGLFRWVQAQVCSPGTPGSFKNASGHVGIPLKRSACNQRGDIFTLNGGSLKLVNKFTCLGNSVSSTENYINMQQAKCNILICRCTQKHIQYNKDERTQFFRKIYLSLYLKGFERYYL